MTDLTALTDLIARIKGLKGDDPWDEKLVTLAHRAFSGGDAATAIRLHLYSALRGSLDAAVAFTEALLPEAKKLIREEAKDWVTTHWRAVLELPKPPYTMVGDAPTPALALVLAALKAHAAKETT